MINKKDVYKKLETVIDPELGVDIVKLGFIYEVDISENKIKVLMTLTTPGCPLAGVIDKMVREAVASISGVEKSNVTLEITFDPPWTADMMSEEARLNLGFI